MALLATETATGHLIVSLLLILVVAKLAAEVAERIGVPAVLAEILTGVVIGPSMIGVVSGGEVLRFLGEIGVILLLFQVGLEMDIAELTAVGRASITVAVVGVALPFVGGIAVASAFGEGGNTAVFLGASLVATSVGITARVFGDLRALSTVEARTVLGAAVADDVLGLVILTVVVRLVETGSFSVVALAGVVGLAVAFLVVAGGLGVRFGPRLTRLVATRARSSGTLFVFAIGATLAFSAVADLARLAPIIGAFVAGLALARSDQVERVRRDLTPVAHIFVPVFFVMIGVDLDVHALLRPSVLGLAGGLLVVAAVGKIAASVGALGSPGDRWLIGIGMLPRGEVGLIFAGIGLSEGVLDRDLYAALLLVVLVTTLVTPPLLRWRTGVVRRARRLPTAATPVPEGGWLQEADGVVDLAGTPGGHLALHLALEAARRVASARPGPTLISWLSALGDTPLPWDATARAELLELLRAGNARSWRFLETTGVLDRVLPDLAETLGRRRADASELDPGNVLRWATVEGVRALEGTPEHRRLEHPDRLLLAALILDATGDVPSVAATRQLVKRLDLGAAAEQEVALLVADRALLHAAASRPDGLDEERVLQIASHLETPERARALYLLTLGRGGLERWVRERLDALHRDLQATLAAADLSSRDARNVAERRRIEAARLAGDASVADRLAHAPRRWLLALPAVDLVRQATLLEPLPARDAVRVAVTPTSVEVAARDRRGLLAHAAGVLAEARLRIDDAVTATWGDGGVVMCFGVSGPDVDPRALEARLRSALRDRVVALPVPDAALTFDDDASPWYTLADVEAVDREGLLHALAAAFSAANVSIHSARVATVGTRAHDRFELTGERGGKLTEAEKVAVRAVFAGGSGGSRRRPWARDRSSRRPATETKQSSNRAETAAL
ncbi:MAG TPA: cation:proton antiporter [Acidimicrobiales bacterium]|nr:cation:proton antiporter [Acidimicrobiales bacterium]